MQGGDAVLHVLDKRPMMVRRIERTTSGRQCLCVWFVDGEPQTGTFPVEELVPAARRWQAKRPVRMEARHTPAPRHFRHKSAVVKAF